MFLEVSFRLSPKLSRTTRRQLLWCLFVALLFIFRNGYQFNCYDQEEHLPMVYNLQDPALYPHDYFVQEMVSHVTVRTAFVKTVYFFTKMMSVETACFLLFIVCVTLTAFLILKIAELWYGYSWGSLLSPVFVLLLYNAWTVGGNAVMDLQLLGSGFAVVFCLAGIYMFLKGHYRTAGLLLGIAALYQVLMGLHVLLILALVLLLLHMGTAAGKLRRLVLFFLLSSSPVLVPVLYRQFFLPGAHDMGLSNYAQINFRGAHHYLPGAFPVATYVHHIALWLLAVVIVLCTKAKHRKFFFLFTGIIIAGCIFYTVCFELWKPAFIAKTQWFKTTVWTTVCSGIILAGLTGQLIERFFSVTYIQRRWITPALFACIALLLLHITNQPLFTRTSWLGRYMIGKYPHADITKLHEWIRDNTAKDAVILSFPYDPSILCEARRSTVVAYKMIAQEPRSVENWYHIFTRVYNISDTPGPLNVRRKDYLPAATLWYNAANNETLSARCYYDYRIAEAGTPGALADSAAIVHREGNYVLVRNNARVSPLSGD